MAHVLVVCEMIDSELIDWWQSKSAIDREAILFQAYELEKLDKVIHLTKN